MDLVESRWPGVPILPVFGNNDMVYTYQPPNLANKLSYYNAWYEIFLNGVSANSGFASGVESDFDNYGSYRYDVPNSDVTFLNINTMYLNYYNVEDATTPPQLVNWIDT